MDRIIEVLEKTDTIYDDKLDSAIEKITYMDVTDEKFDSLLATISKLISLKLQKIEFIKNYEENKEEK